MRRLRVAWFSPLPPSTSGIAAYSAELLPLLRARGLPIETFTDANAQDFVWKHRRDPFDLTVYHLGNASCHDYMWGYLFRYPGLVVLHDAQLHQARALALTKRWWPRRADYLAEFRANHPDAPPYLGELIASGHGAMLYQHWPLIGLVIESARLTVVHNRRVADQLREQHPTAAIESIEMGTADPLHAPGAPLAPSRTQAAVRLRHQIPEDAVVLAAFGGVTPEKRIPQLLRALSELAEHRPNLHLMLVGNAARHYDVAADARAWRVADRVHVTGYVADDALPSYLDAADVCVCLRWPTNRETSASWLRCLAAGRATIITELTHLADVPTVDPRGWRTKDVLPAPRQPVAVSIDLLDEDHSLPLALERLAVDAGLRNTLGSAARAWWSAHHQLEPMADAYLRLCNVARDLPRPRPSLPRHLTDDGTRLLHDLLGDVGPVAPVTDLLRN
jgi:glycosyltransferase involved in cell wall biosynthesis